MTTFTVWRFPDPCGAGRAELALKTTEIQGLVQVVEHAVISWPRSAEKPTLRHEHDSAEHEMVWRGLWGVLGGALFAIPVAGVVLGAGTGVLTNVTEGTGITEDDLERIYAAVIPGTSALFVVTGDADVDRLDERFDGRDGLLVSIRLTDAEHATLLETFGGA